jgi:hypothetical protein
MSVFQPDLTLSLPFRGRKKREERQGNSRAQMGLEQPNGEEGMREWGGAPVSTLARQDSGSTAPGPAQEVEAAG